MPIGLKPTNLGWNRKSGDRMPWMVDINIKLMKPKTGKGVPSDWLVKYVHKLARRAETSKKWTLLLFTSAKNYLHCILESVISRKRSTDAVSIIQRSIIQRRCRKHHPNQPCRKHHPTTLPRLPLGGSYLCTSGGWRLMVVVSFWKRWFDCGKCFRHRGPM